MVALRDNESGAVAFGVNPIRVKLSAFAVSGCVASMAGVVLVIHQAAFRQQTYGAEESLLVFSATVVGGLGSLLGAVLGSVFQRGSQWLLPAPWSVLATGVGVLVVLLSAPDGLGGVVFRVRDRALAYVARKNSLSELNFNRESGIETPTDLEPDETVQPDATVGPDATVESDATTAPDAPVEPDADSEAVS